MTRETRVYAGRGMVVLVPGLRFLVPDGGTAWAVEYGEDQQWWCDCGAPGTCQHIRQVIEAEMELAQLGG